MEEIKKKKGRPKKNQDQEIKEESKVTNENSDTPKETVNEEIPSGGIFSNNLIDYVIKMFLGKK